MRLFRKLFGETKITWKFLLVYSVATAVIVGLLNCVPFLENTSFTAPAVNLEYWVVAAVFIISNCKSAKEAMIKTFLFFLVSQPLIYLVEVPFKAAGWELFQHYKYWGMLTILTIPGAAIAYQIKRDKIISAVILSVATGFLLATGVSFIRNLFTDFPRGLLAAVFCLMFGIVLIQAIMKRKNTRIIAYICSIVFAVAIFFSAYAISSNRTTGTLLESDHQWEITEADTDAEINGNYLRISSRSKGTFFVTVKNENGETQKYEVIFSDDTTVIEQVE